MMALWRDWRRVVPTKMCLVLAYLSPLSYDIFGETALIRADDLKLAFDVDIVDSMRTSVHLISLQLSSLTDAFLTHFAAVLDNVCLKKEQKLAAHLRAHFRSCFFGTQSSAIAH